MRSSIFLLVISLLFDTLVTAQNKKNMSFLITGELKSRDTGIIVLWYPKIDGQYVKDTTFVKQGKFQFAGDVFEPSFCWLIGSKASGNTTGFFLEAGRQQIVLEENEFDDFFLSGSFAQKQQDTLTQSMKTIELKYKNEISEYNRLVKQKRTEIDSIGKEIISEKITRIATILNEERLKQKLQFIIHHPDSYVSPATLQTVLINRQLATDSVASLYNNFSAAIKKSIPGRLIRQELDKRRVNILAANFTAQDITDQKISLVDFKDSYVLLNFWASWCIPCIKEIPQLKTLLDTYRTKGFEIINISIDDKKQNWVRAVEKYNIRKFRNVIVNNDIEKNYPNVKQPIPSQLLINNKGLLIWNSMNKSSQSLEKILKTELGN